MTEQDPFARIRDLGLETAAEVVERMLELGHQMADLRIPLLPAGRGDGGGGGGGGDEDAADPEATGQLRRLRADADRLIDLYGDWSRTLLDSVMDMASQGRGAARESVDALVLGPVSPGDEAVATAWLHLLDGAPATATMRATDLTRHDGKVVAAAHIHATPAAVERTAPGASVELTVAVVVPADAEPGTYRGHLLATGLPDVALAMRLEVSPP